MAANRSESNHPAPPPAAWQLGVVALVCASVAAAVRIPLLWDDPWASGYDGWYYVLQTRSWMDGSPLFADRSLVFAVLRGLAGLTGDVVVGNKVAACLFAGLGAGGMALGSARFTGSWAAGLAAGMWWACAPGHLTVSFEFLKNEGGLAVLGILWALLSRARSSPMAALSALMCTGLGLAVHKLTGVFGLVLTLGTAGTVAWERWSVRDAVARRRAVRGLLAAAAVLGLVSVSVGVLRLEDFTRFLSPGIAEGTRSSILLSSPRIHPVHRVTLAIAHLLPLILAITLWRWSRLVSGLAWILLAIFTTAPLLPFGFDLTAWRLLLLAFVPSAFALAVGVAHTRPWTGPALGLLFLGSIPWTLPHAAGPEPDYAAWAETIPTLQAHVAEHERVVAHRGVCGFVWAQADRVCENFDPQGSAEGWWRIVYGMGEARLAPYSDVEPVRLMLGYTLVPEAAWRRFRAEQADTLPLIQHPRNPYRARPGFVYGPQRDSPRVGEGP